MAVSSGKTSDIKNDPNAEVFDIELKRAGFVRGENLIVESYSAEGRPERHEALAREVVSTQPDVIVSFGTPLTLRFKAATSTIPIVALTGDPIRFGLLSSLAHPGGNIAGVSLDAGVEVWGKRLELLTELPALYHLREQVEAGGLMAYSYDLKSALRRQAMQVAEVLRGANPADMPYFQETRFELVINLKTAKELGLEIPAGLVAGAAAVIE